MSILYLLLPIAIIFLIIAIIFFFWAIKNNQYDDLQSPALKVIIDDYQQKKVKTADESQQPDAEPKD